MPKSNTKLVIVESPSKAKTIGKYLGPQYVVKASMGHLRDLQKSMMSVDLENDFEPQYYPIKGKEALIEELKKAAANSEEVYLATDPDREGEAISWHIKYLLGISDEKTFRVTFQEITKDVVVRAIAQPRGIDQNLVDAQQARRVLDRIVGYQLSPLLWKKIQKGLSAGRVQSVATRMVVDRENEIRAFVPEEYWSLDVELARREKTGSLTARYYGSPKKRELTSEQQADEVIRAIKGKPFVVSDVKQSDKKKNPQPPFTTSTLQQDASRKLGMTPKRTMAIAQQLYEGVEISGEGSVGLITYMRTDSLRISEEALSAAGALIKERYGKQYYASARRYKPKSTAQDAHEAIRPSNVYLTPERVEKDLTRDQFRLYKLIWSRFIASQMLPAVYDVTAVTAECAQHVFRASHQSVRFAGFTAVYEESLDEEQGEKLSSPLPELSQGEQLELVKVDPQQHFTQPPARYSEATLVRAMEEKGVGRPSTYATIVSTIQDKEYVVKKDKKLAPTPLGEVVNGLLMDHFQNIINVEFTADMERQLDSVEEGKIAWKTVLEDFYTGFHQEMLEAEKALSGVHLKVPDEVTDEVCELCGRNMVIKVGKFGKFLACPGYPECKNAKPLVERMPGRCPKCGSAMLKRKSKKGYAYYACEKGKDCGFMTWDVPTDQDCPICHETMFKRAGKGAMKPFCINEKCENFLPEDKRGYKKKTAKKDGAEEKTAKKTKSTARKTTAKKTAAKKKETT